MPHSQRKTTPHPMPDQEILNIDGAAALLGVSVKTFSKVLREGDVPGRKVGREWKFSRQALIDWIGGAQSRHFLDGGSDGESRPSRLSRRRKSDDDPVSSL
jgi:excisionase family DNA binding protein